MPRTRIGEPALIRELNLSIVLHALSKQGALSRAALAAETGLTKVTVSALAKQLLDLGFVVERGTNKNGLGRPGILLELNPQAGAMIGVEIGVDFISVILTDFSARTLWRNFQQTEATCPQEKILDQVVANIRVAVMHAKKNRLRVLGLAVALPGLVDVASGTLLYAPNLKWENVPVRGLLLKRFAFPIYVDNESSISAFGETTFGVARGMRNLAYVYAGVGVGGGLVVDGKLMAGATGLAGEIGHMTLEPDGPLCNCGNYGCWETLASQSALFHRIQCALDAGAPSRLAHFKQKKHEHLTVAAVVEAADAGDPVAREALAETGKYLGIGISNLVNTLNPEIVVIGGSLSQASHYLLPVIQQALDKRALRWSRSATRLVIAANGADAPVMGGIAVIYDHVMQHPLQVRRPAPA